MHLARAPSRKTCEYESRTSPSIMAPTAAYTSDRQRPPARRASAASLTRSKTPSGRSAQALARARRQRFAVRLPKLARTHRTFGATHLYAAARAGEHARLDWNVTRNDRNLPIHTVHLHPPRASRRHGGDGFSVAMWARQPTFRSRLPARIRLPSITLAPFPRTPGDPQPTWPAVLFVPPRLPVDPTLRVLLLALLVFLLTGFYARFRFDPGPYAGPAIHHFQPPEDASAASATCLMGSGYDIRAQSAGGSANGGF